MKCTEWENPQKQKDNLWLLSVRGRAEWRVTVNGYKFLLGVMKIF